MPRQCGVLPACRAKTPTHLLSLLFMCLLKITFLLFVFSSCLAVRAEDRTILLQFHKAKEELEKKSVAVAEAAMKGTVSTELTSSMKNCEDQKMRIALNAFESGFIRVGMSADTVKNFFLNDFPEDKELITVSRGYWAIIHVFPNAKLSGYPGYFPQGWFIFLQFSKDHKLNFYFFTHDKKSVTTSLLNY